MIKTVTITQLLNLSQNSISVVVLWIHIFDISELNNLRRTKGTKTKQNKIQLFFYCIHQKHMEHPLMAHENDRHCWGKCV